MNRIYPLHGTFPFNAIGYQWLSYVGTRLGVPMPRSTRHRETYFCAAQSKSRRFQGSLHEKWTWNWQSLRVWYSRSHFLLNLLSRDSWSNYLEVRANLLFLHQAGWLQQIQRERATVERCMDHLNTTHYKRHAIWPRKGCDMQCLCAGRADDQGAGAACCTASSKWGTSKAVGSRESPSGRQAEGVLFCFFVTRLVNN